MSRKSRRNNKKNDTYSVITYDTGIYVRKSAVNQNNLESIENQIHLLHSYIKMHRELILIDTYIDNGKSGVTFQREGFQRLLLDISLKKINCVIVKDFSRFGRNLVGTGDFLEYIFPSMGVRFISVNDNYDSKVTQPDITSTVKQFYNELYARDISNKTRSVYQIKQKQGFYLGSIAPYGYLKSPQNKYHLCIDEEAAFVVKQIFQWRVQKMAYHKIAIELNQRKIIPPMQYFYKKGLLKKEVSNKGKSWYPSTVARILSNPVYTGKMVQRKYQSLFVEGMKHLPVPKENWIIVNHTHSPIIDEALFLQVQKMEKKPIEKKEFLENSTDNLLKNKVFCKDCGKRMLRKKSVFSKQIHYYYRCPSYEALKQCKQKSIREDRLYRIIFTFLFYQIQLTKQWETISKKIEYDEKVKKKITESLKKYQFMKNSVKEGYQNQLLNKEEYYFAKEGYQKEIQRLLELEKNQNKLEIQTFLQWIIKNGLKRIEVTENSGIELFFLYTQI